jgi:uncharacterized protein YbjT (DUF2867 family)
MTMPGEKLVLVTGATGKQGGAVARELLSHGFRLRAMTRKVDGEPARALAGLGAAVVHGDFDAPDSLEAALKDVWGVFAVQNTWEAGVAGEEEQGKRFADLAKQFGTQHFVYSSVGSADRNTGIPHFDNKWRIEERVRQLGFPSFVIIRPVFFMENFVSPWFKPGIDQGKLMIALKPETVLQMIAVDDIGKYGRWAFEHYQALNGRAIDIAGDARTMPEAARIIGEAAGRPVEFAPPPIEEVRKSGQDFATMLEWFDRVGYNAKIPLRAKESGIAPTTFAEWAARANWAGPAA